MHKETAVVFIKKMLFMAIGMLVQSGGVYLLIRSKLGLAPVALLNQGLSVAFHVSYGGGALISGLSCLFIVLVWCRKYINIGTFIITFSFGILVDVVSSVLDLFIPAADGPWMQCLYFAVGFFLLNYGIGLVVATRIGAGSVEALTLTIAYKTGIPFKWVKVMFEVLCVIVGVLLVWPESFVGTVILALLSGPAVAHGIRLSDRYILEKVGLHGEEIK